MSGPPQLHDKEGQPFVFFDLVNDADVGMIQTRTYTPDAPVMIAVFLSAIHTPLFGKARVSRVKELEAHFAQSWVIIGTAPE